MLMFLSMIETPEEADFCEKLYTKYRRDVFFVARAHLNNDPDAEDVAQTVFAEVAEKYLRRLIDLPPEKQKIFLLVLSKSRALDLIKANSKYAPLEEAVAAAPAYDDETLEKLLIRDSYEELAEALGLLDLTDRTILWLRFSAGFSFREIGEMLDMKPDTASKRQRRAIEKLRAILEGEGGAK